MNMELSLGKKKKPEETMPTERQAIATPLFGLERKCCASALLLSGSNSFLVKWQFPW